MTDSSTAAPGGIKRDAASEAAIPPHSNTGVSSPSSPAGTDVGAHAAACLSRVRDGQSTIIDTLSLVFPLLALVPDYEAVQVGVDQAPTPRAAMRMPEAQQLEFARRWWGEDREQPPRDDLIEAWVNHLWRLEVAMPRTASLESDIDQVSSAFDWMLSAFGLALSPRSRGRNGFTFSADLVPAEWNYYRDGHPPALGHVAWGGITDRFDRLLAQFHLTGQGCAELSLVDGWDRLYAWAFDLGAHVTRCDVALDDFEAANGDVDAWVQRYHDGGFALRQQPSHSHITGDHGDTLYVGSRQSGKLCRVYAKGQQLGDAASPWVRIEVELRNSQRHIPLDILRDPDAYFAGAYPALEGLEVSPDPVPIVTLVRNTAAATLTSLIDHAQRSYGRLIHVLQRIGYAPSEILDRLSLEGVPSRLGTVSFIGALEVYD